MKQFKNTGLRYLGWQKIVKLSEWWYFLYYGDPVLQHLYQLGLGIVANKFDVLAANDKSDNVKSIRFYLNILLLLWTNLCHLAFRTDCMFLHVVIDDYQRRPRTSTRKLQRLTLCVHRNLHRSAWLDPAKLICLPILQSVVQPRT